MPVPESDLPVLLPDEVEFKPTGESPLLSNQAFRQREVSRSAADPRARETDTMDTFVDSIWYFLRFLSPDLDTAAFDSEAVDRWLPVDQYIGGVEHAILHLLYSRFIVKVLRDMGIVALPGALRAPVHAGHDLARTATRCRSRRATWSPPTP